MKAIFLCLFVAAIGNVVYHLGQKLLPSAINPMLLLMVVYALAFVLAAMLLPFFSSFATVAELGALFSWPVLVVATGVLLIEMVFLLAYRLGGAVQWSGAAVNGMAAIMLAPLSLLFFQEAVSLNKILGIGLVLAGMYFLVSK